MKGFVLASLALAIMPACGAGDDVAGGSRENCAQGGALTDCPDAERTSQGACWRLVDCGAIAVDVDVENEPNRFDWGTCVDALDSMIADRRRLVVGCIAASTCDQLRVDGSPDRPNGEQLYCLRLGED